MNKSRQKKLENFMLENIADCSMSDGRISWKKLAELIEERFPSENSNPERLRSLYRRHVDEGYQKHLYNKNTKELAERELLDIEELVLRKIKKKYAIPSLAERVDVSEEEVQQVIVELQFRGYDINIWTENGTKYVQKSLKNRHKAEPGEHRLNKDGEQLRIAIFSDTHLGHAQSAKEELQYFVHEAYRQGVRDIFFVGDLVEGHYMSIRPTSIKELEAIGFDDQIDLAAETLPRLDGLTYHMISGNHDGTFSRNAFANPVKTLARERDDVKFLGHNFAKVWLNDKIDITLVHPTDGIGQNYSLKMRQHIDRARTEKLSKFIFMGHYHKFDHTFYRGINGWIMPSFVRYSHFMDDKNLASIIGGIILTINTNDEGDLVSFLPEYFFFDEN